MEPTNSNDIITVTSNFLDNDINVVTDRDSGDSNLISSERVISGIYFAIGSLGIIANGLVIFVFFASKRLRKFTEMTNIYLLNQSILDMTAAVFLVLLTLFESQDPTLMVGIGGELYCRLWLNKLPLWSVLVSSTFNLVVINIERYLGILHAIWHKNYFNGKVIKATLVFIWMVGFLYNTSYLLPTSFILDGQCFFLAGWSPLAQRIVGVLTAIVQFFLPVTIHAFCCIKIVLFLNQRVSRLDDVSSTTQQQGSTQQAHKKNAALRIRNQVLKTLTLMTACFILCWVWNQVLFFLASLGLSVDFQGSFYHFTVIAVYMNCFTSPFVYVFKYQMFREEAKKIFFRKHNSISDMNTTVVTHDRH